MIRKNLFLLLVACISGWACSGSPSASQRTRVLLRSDMDALGHAMQTEIERHYTILQHQMINRYVNALGQTIISHNAQMPQLPYQFRILRTNEINAFSIPGGTIYVTLGLLSQCEMEGQFAAALAHELAHQDAGHPLLVWQERVTNAQDWVHSSRDSFETQYFGKNGLLDYGKGYEDEADEIALILLYQAGFDPRAYISYLELVQRLNNKSKQLIVNLMALHPPIDARLAEAKIKARIFPPKREQKMSSANFTTIKQLLKIASKMQAKEKKRGEM